MTKKVKVHKGGFVYLKDFEGLIDTDKVHSYTIKVNKDKTLTIKFYDDKKKVVKPNGKQKVS